MQTTIPLYGFGGGGGTGAALTVNAPAGCTVTVSKDGKTKTKVAGTDGVAVFKGLATGAWTVSISDGEQTAQKSVTITADYSTAITFFTATIHVTYPAGFTCTATDDVTTLTAPDTSGTWDCVVPNAGAWTLLLGNGLFATVSVDNGGSYTVKDWSLYDNGKYENITGGWYSDVVDGYITQAISVPSSGTRKIFTNKKLVNISGFRKVTFVINSSDPVYSSTEVGIYSTYGNAANITPVAFADIKSYTPNTDTEFGFNIKDDMSECYFGFGINRTEGSSGATTTLRVKTIKLCVE